MAEEENYSDDEDYNDTEDYNNPEEIQPPAMPESQPSKRQAVVTQTNPGTSSVIVHKVAEHYNARENQSREQRESSPIIHLKKLNNWVKSVLLKSHGRRFDCALDLACGKGGDLTKWERLGIGYYVGVDVAGGSVNDARMRYNGDAMDSRKQSMNFPARFIHADCYGVSLQNVLNDVAPFDIVSCQFAFHYCFQTEGRARMALKNISDVLRSGGLFVGTMPDANVIVQKLRHSKGLEFGNRVYNIKFSEQHSDKVFPASNPFGIEYHFHLEDAVDCPEWLVAFPFLQRLAGEYDLELEMKANFHEYIQIHSHTPEFATLMRRIVGDGWHERITEDEWDAAYLYMVFVFRKTGKSVKPFRRKRFPAPSAIDESSIIVV